MKFAAGELPEANDLTVGIMPLVTQQEREAISRRTKEASSIARSRGVRFGNPNGAAALRRSGKGGSAFGPRSPATRIGMPATWHRSSMTSAQVAPAVCERSQ